ncbi:flagellar basal body rod C-terminal domain-containing protein [Oceanobacillus senegalensis]|uniref:flagellar basal body rod C-terminal domain-containing protein n=1 Tax=Oceanobacillus senegalensis TaxID=1936063 RepID=UPI001FEABF73|nr:flagellar basal body rod C-terminal domain-containing protein [Oceanobacillus senegalensis]
MKVNEIIVEDPNLIAASMTGDTGDSENASKIAGVFDEVMGFDTTKTTIKDFYQSVIGELGVVAQGANRMVKNTSTLLSQVENQRMSVSSVSLDEEMTNMIKFQHAYNAAARSMTATDELLDKIINNMGLVGR